MCIHKIGSAAGKVVEHSFFYMRNNIYNDYAKHREKVYQILAMAKQ